MSRCFIYGAGGFASVVFDTAEICGFEISGFIDDFSNGADRSFCDRPVYSAGVLQEGDVVFMGFGNNPMRQKKGNELLQRGIRMPALIHPAAVVSRLATVGEGCFIGATAVVDPLCRIGRFTILNKGSIIGHQTVIGEAANICPGVALAGNVEISDLVWIGIGSTVIEKIKIAGNVYIGGGAVVVKDITEEDSLYFGVPAVLRKMKHDN